MPRNSFNDAFRNARNVKNDEYYTLYEDVVAELDNDIYYENLKDKTIFCPCDDYRYSAFVKYFKENFNKYQLKLLISVNKDSGEGAYEYQYDGTNEYIKEIEDGDYNSARSTEIMLYEADVIITNPPFSKTKDFVPKIINTGKKFLILGSLTSIAYHAIFPYYMNNKIGFGLNINKRGTRKGNQMEYALPDGTRKSIPSWWYSNINNEIPYLILKKKYDPDFYVTYDNAPNVLNVNSKRDIPKDYYREMGVPVTVLPFINKNQFEVVGKMAGQIKTWFNVYGSPFIDGKEKFVRIIIKRKEDGIEKEC